MALRDRLARLEAMSTALPPITIDIWVPTEDGGGYRHTQSGDTLTTAQFRQRHPPPFTIAIDRASTPTLLEDEDA